MTFCHGLAKKEKAVKQDPGRQGPEWPEVKASLGVEGRIVGQSQS